jgi:hypothetical protein
VLLKFNKTGSSEEMMALPDAVVATGAPLSVAEAAGFAAPPGAVGRPTRGGVVDRAGPPRGGGRVVGSLRGGAFVEAEAGIVRDGRLVTAVGAVFVALTAGWLFVALLLSGGAACPRPDPCAEQRKQD